MKKVFFGILATLMFAISTTMVSGFSVTPDTSTNVTSNSFDGIVVVTDNLDSGLKVFVGYRIKGSGIWTSLPGLQKVDTGDYSLTFSFTGLSTGQTYEWGIGYQIPSQSPQPVPVGATLEIILLGPPTITASNQPTNQTVNEGDAVTFTVTPTGNPSLFAYQWYKGATATTANNVISGETDSTLSFSSVNTANDAYYKCTVSNGQGSPVNSNVVKLTVRVAPAITSQPQSITVNPGDNATVSVVASGTAPLTYRWEKNGILTNVSTASFTLYNVIPSDTCTLRCFVSNVVSSDTSDYATISVTLKYPDVEITDVDPSNDGGSVTVEGNGYGLETEVRLIYGSDSTNWESVGTGFFTYTFPPITGLGGCTTMQVRPEARNDVGPTPGAVANLTTNVLYPVAETNDPLPVGTTTADFNGTWESNGVCALAVVSYRFNYKKVGSSVILHAPVSWASVGTGSGIITESVTGLLPNTTYKVQLEVKNAAGKNDLGNEISFTTGQTPVTYTANFTVSSWPVSDIVGTNAKITFKASTNDPTGMEVRAVHDTVQSMGITAIPNGPITVVGNTLTTYSINLTDLIPGRTNYVLLEYTLNTNGSNSQYPTTAISFFVPALVGMQELEGKAMKMFPNPVADALTITADQDGVFALYDIIGKKVGEQTIMRGENKLEWFGNVNPGLYMFQFMSEYGKMHSGKIQVAR